MTTSLAIWIVLPFAIAVLNALAGEEARGARYVHAVLPANDNSRRGR